MEPGARESYRRGLSPAPRAGFFSSRIPGFRSLRSLHPGLYASACSAGSLKGLLLGLLAHEVRVNARDRSRFSLFAFFLFPYAIYLPIANRCRCDLTNILPSEIAGVAINGSPIEFVVKISNFDPALTTNISPSS